MNTKEPSVSSPPSGPLNPRAAIFDMDGLMIDTEAIYRVAWQGAARKCGFEISDELYDRFTGRPIPACEALLMQVLEDSVPDLPARMEPFRVLRREAWLAHVEEHGIPRKPGLIELLDELAARGIPISVATSSAREDALFCLGEMAARFQTITTGCEVTHGKPAPDIFLLALERTEKEASECLVFEDSEAGVEAAHAAGIPVIMVPDLKPASEQARKRALRVCYDLHEARALLA
jgi:HAD superfamily hydrolase (TIGR01509 family)